MIVLRCFWAVAYLVGLITPPKGTVCQSDKQPFAPGLG